MAAITLIIGIGIGWLLCSISIWRCYQKHLNRKQRLHHGFDHCLSKHNGKNQ